MNNCVFTIVAKNYIGLAHILEAAVKKHSSDVDFYIMVADEFNQNYTLSSNVLIAKQSLDIPSEVWTDMSFKYDLTEFCTAIKPFSFSFFFNRGYEKVIYFDPDIYVFSSLSPIYNELCSHSAVLTPQINGIHVDYKGEHPEYAMNLNGIFNMGFCALKSTSTIRHFVKWWEERLRIMCFEERSMGYFTDQKWIDWLPGFLESDQLCVSRNLGMNLAPWNFFERRIVRENGQYYVTYRENENGLRKDKLIFLHYAGYDYNCFKRGEIKRKRISKLQDYEDLKGVQSDYRDAIMNQSETFDSFINLPYSYNFFENGVLVNKFHRRLYDGLVCKGIFVKKPFSVGKGSFYAELLRVGMINKKENVDKIKKDNISNMEGKRNLLNKFYTCLFKIIGYKRYTLFLRSHIIYTNLKEHVFLIDAKKTYD